MDAKDIAALFSNREPIEIDFKNTSHGDEDFRETLFADFGTDKIVIKLAANVFESEKQNREQRRKRREEQEREN